MHAAGAHRLTGLTLIKADSRAAWLSGGVCAVSFLEQDAVVSLIKRTEEIWETVFGAEKVHQIYGYWPTLHDARVQGVKIDCDTREVLMVVDYCDVGPVDDAGDICTRFTLRWQGVMEAKLRLADNSLYGLYMERESGCIRSRFEDYAYGFDGTILAQSLSVSDVLPAPELKDGVDESALFLNIS